MLSPSTNFCCVLALSVLSVSQGFVASPPTSSSAMTLKASDKPMDAPSLAQTHMQGPLTVNGSGKALTKEELDEIKEELAEIKEQFGFQEPTRSFMDGEDTKWRFGGAPDYSLTNLFYLKERSKIHPEDSLEKVVENLVKTWEMERSHKLDPNQHQSVDTENFRISANGGKIYDNIEANQVGNYNVLLDACPADIWDKENISWEDSHEIFHKAFAAFPWEVLEVYSGPPKVAFSWRHWATFTGEFEGNKGKGELVEMYGFGTAVVNDKLQLQDVEVYYDAQEFLSVLRGEKEVTDTNAQWNSNHGCPFTAMKGAMGLADPATQMSKDFGSSSTSATTTTDTPPKKKRGLRRLLSKLTG